jgi:iron complex outermembrane receptor protein
MRYRDLRGALASSVAICAVAIATPAMAQTKSFNVPAQAAATGLPQLATQADVQILVSADAVRGKTIRAIKGRMSVDQAVRRAAADADLRVVSSDGRTYTLAPATSASADDYVPSEIVVTAQKRVEAVQDVPIAITALSQKNLEEQKIEGGPDIMRAVPNMTFSKSNFTGYNISIRGIGTKSISATSDPGVAVAFNNSSLIHNRFFEQEFFDMERVEVLRGPQGTLYGRNATGGVVNLITAKPDFGGFEGNIKGEVGNYNSRRLLAMLNVPLVDDVLAVRVAGSMTRL